MTDLLELSIVSLELIKVRSVNPKATRYMFGVKKNPGC